MGQLLAQRLESMPDFMTGNDLVALGLYRSNNALYIARLRGQAPDHIKFLRKILYPRDAVIAFINAHSKSGSMAKSDNINIK